MKSALRSPYGEGESQHEPMGSPPVDTALQIAVAWLIAFVCIALVTFLA